MAKQGYCAAGGGEPPEEWEREERREAAEGAEAVDGRDLLPGVDSDDEDLGEDALYQLAMEWSSDYLVHDG